MVETKPRKGKKLSDREHLLLRPDQYIGSTASVDKEVWILDEPDEETPDDTDDDNASEDIKSTKNTEKRIVKQMFENYNSAFSRIHVENFSNIIDNKWESEKMGVKMTTAKIDFIDNTFRTENDGRWVPIELQEFEEIDPVTKKKIMRKAYPIEVFFTELRSGTNYEDEEERKTSGRNGQGVKCLTTFSTKVTITCFDPQNKLKQVLYAENNLTKIEVGKPEKYTGKVGRTIIECVPDFERFGLTGYTKKWIAYFKKHAYDMSMIMNGSVKVYFNGDLLPVKNLKQYVQTVLGKKVNMIEMSAQGKNVQCEVVLAERELEFAKDDKNLAHISFVNGIYTKNGGTHVNSWGLRLLGQIRDHLNKNIKLPKGIDEKKVKIPKYGIDFFQQYFIIFIRCEVDKPAFDSQTKHELQKPKITFAAKSKKSNEEECQFSDKDGKFTYKELDGIMKWNFVTAAQDRWQFELDKVFTKTGKEQDKHHDPKVRLANWANTSKKDQTLFYISEGDSAHGLFEAGCSYIENGFDKYGGFPIKGKLPNAMKKSSNLVSVNKEVRTIMGALNIRKGIDYLDKNNKSTLSHSGLRLATDSDADGTHIAMLILALLYAYSISLFKAGFVSIHVFPKASRVVRGKKVFYYREQDYQGLKGIKYYKGLGTFRNEDAEEFFENPKIITLIPTIEDEKWMNFAMGNGESDSRKNWISNYINRQLEKELNQEVIQGDLKIPQFIQENLSIFFSEAFYRAIPSFVDGLKEGQRKCIYSLIKKNIYMNDSCNEGAKKIVNLQGRVMEDAEYHHGDMALSGTFVNLARGFVGTNNIPWCFNDGQFGTRHGLEAAAARYIHSALDPIIKHIINKKDLPICNYKVGEDKPTIEPDHYPTLIPMLLVNGSAGIAVGFANNVPCFNPLDLVTGIKEILAGEEVTPLVPWYRNFIGKIAKNGKTWSTQGIFKETSKGVYEITELPVGIKTQTYKKFLWDWKKGKKAVKRITEHHEVNKVNFKITVDSNDAKLNADSFKLNSNLKFNMWLVNHDSRPVNYTSVENYLEDWVAYRLGIYKKRKEYWLVRLKFEKEVAEEKVRFIKQVIDDEIVIKGKRKANLIEELLENGYRKCKMSLYQWLTDYNESDSEEEEIVVDDEEETVKEKGWSLDYLTKIHITQQTTDEVEKFEKEAKDKKEAYKAMKNKKIEDMWIEELDEFVDKYEKFLTIRNASDGKKRKDKKTK